MFFLFVLSSCKLEISKVDKSYLIHVLGTRHNSADSVPTSNLVCIKEVAIRTIFNHMEQFTTLAAKLPTYNVPVTKNALNTRYPIPKQTLVFTCLQYMSFENTVGKGEIARNEQFLLFPQCFLPIRRTICQFHQI